MRCYEICLTNKRIPVKLFSLLPWMYVCRITLMSCGWMWCNKIEGMSTKTVNKCRLISSYLTFNKGNKRAHTIIQISRLRIYTVLRFGIKLLLCCCQITQSTFPNTHQVTKFCLLLFILYLFCCRCDYFLFIMIFFIIIIRIVRHCYN